MALADDPLHPAGDRQLARFYPAVESVDHRHRLGSQPRAAFEQLGALPHGIAAAGLEQRLEQGEIGAIGDEVLLVVEPCLRAPAVELLEPVPGEQVGETRPGVEVDPRRKQIVDEGAPLVGREARGGDRRLDRGQSDFRSSDISGQRRPPVA